ncbi:AraC family transcriptional regulator [Paraburkholderia ginsengiterrae]|uniref:AraC family transcriptional regulator n=1 Tax=Paraburkholderia ginsengiterrae TaxID=1462993 RepID=A0A1A9N6C7_9BURK|nr:AraC family transcriptional regulator [Paraburkholderia ginsengiterrae]OAJ60169.1 AraC family transcriptional regulator [Paraburkholderia ginsengiterrae]
MPRLDWLSRLLVMMPVTGQLEIRCSFGAPWRIAYERSNPGEMPYHVVVSGSALLEIPGAGAPQHLVAGDILLLSHGSEHVLHDGSGAAPSPTRTRDDLNVEIRENGGTGEHLDMLCGRFVLTPPHDRLMRDYFPAALVVRTAAQDDASKQPATASQLASLVGLIRAESTAISLGGHAMLNALSAALFALTLRTASESNAVPSGMLALAANPRLAPALTAMFDDPAHPWTLPELAQRCNMSRATLIRQFQDSVGRSANDLLTDIRMTLAANELKKPSTSTETVAEVVGYQSLAAFRRAFTQRMGMTPGDWRRLARGSE